MALARVNGVVVVNVDPASAISGAEVYSRIQLTDPPLLGV